MAILRERTDDSYQRLDWRCVVRPRALALTFALLANWLFIRTTAQEGQNRGPGVTAPSSRQAPRIVLPIRGNRDVVFDVPVTSVTVVDQEYVAAEIQGP